MERHLRRTLDQIRRDVRDRDLWSSGARLLIACSGGMDSMALWALLDELSPSLGHRLIIGHVDHGLQSGEAPAALIRARSQATQQQVMLTRLTLARGPDLQARARTARYEALHRMATEANADAIVTAHHADDQAETVLMRACRGAGVAALAGIRWRREDAVVRPLLGLRRAALREAAISLGVRWWEDPSNAAPWCQRNRMRHDVLPALEAAAPGASRGLARTADNAAGNADASGYWVAVAVAPVARREAGALVLPRNVVPSATPRLAPLLAWICTELGVPTVSRAAVQQLARTLCTVPAAIPGNRSADRPRTTCAVRRLSVVIDRQYVRFQVASGQKSEDHDVAWPLGAD